MERINPADKNISLVTNVLMRKVTERQSLGGVDLLGLPTGFDTVDHLTGGMQADQMWTIAGATSSGKSAAALDIALTTATQDKSVVYFSLEMSAESLVTRLISRMTQIDSGRISRGKLSNAELRRVESAARDFSDLRLKLMDVAVSSEDVERLCQQIKLSEDIDLLLVDYAQMLRDDNEFGDTERVGRISNNIRSLAREEQLNAPVVLLSQLNRASQTREDRTPMIHDLKNASDLEQDSQVVLLLDRPYKEKINHGAPPQDIETDARIIIGKNRDGPIATTKAEFHTKTISWKQKYKGK